MELLNHNKKYVSTDLTIYSCTYHVIFTTKYRRNVLNNEIAIKLRSLIFEKQEDYSYQIRDISIMPDHVHIVLDVDPKLGVFNTINRVKKYTSGVMRKEFVELRSRIPSLWTRNNFISSVGNIDLEDIQKYIKTQKGK